MTVVEKLLHTACEEVGYLEKASNHQLDDKTGNAGTGNWTKYARDLDKLGVYNTKKNGYAWCDIFVDWCFISAFGLDAALKMTGQKIGGYGAGSTHSANCYQQMGRFHRSDPRPGDQIFFKAKSSGMCHTGIVESVSNGRVYTIEGNTSSAPGVVANGGSVNKKSYKLSYSKIGGYGRPDWTMVHSNFEEDDDMDIDQFKKLYAEMRKEWQDNDSNPYSAEARSWAQKNGLISGNGADINNEPNCMWADTLTREQFVTVLYRFAQMINKA